MKLLQRILGVLVCLVLLAGCTPVLPGAVTTAPSVTEPTTEPATAPTTEPATEPTTEPATEPTTEPVIQPPEHSELYIPGVSVEDVILWFNEVCLDGEYINSGDPSVVQKWTEPIHYYIWGESTEEDIQLLRSFAEELNKLHGFPGIREAEAPPAANLRIEFCTAEMLPLIMGDNFVGADGAVTFWYSLDEIYEAQICVRSDIGQYLRNSVILEELYNGLGPIQDTLLRPDSIIYQNFAEPQSLTEVDWLILALLYHPDIRCGMNAVECEEVIRRLYY